MTRDGFVEMTLKAPHRRYVDEDVVLIVMTNSLGLDQSAIEVGREIAKIVFDGE